jgi:outer membrane protein assembly factor BamB
MLPGVAHLRKDQLMQARSLFLFVLVAAFAGIASAADWPQWRGPAATGVSEDAKLPSAWGKDDKIAWKQKIPGYGWSCPVVWGDKIFLTTAVSDKQTKPNAGFGGFGMGGFGKGDGKKGEFGKGGFGKGDFGKGGFGGFGGKLPDAVFTWQIYCLDASDGKVLWKQTAMEKKPTVASHASNTYATETPITDGERVYAYFGMTGVFCYDVSGKFVWKADLGSYKMAMGMGTGSSPAFDGERLFIQCDNDEKSFLVALDKRTGKEIWKKPRTERTGWSTPLVWKNKVRTEVVCIGSPKVRSYDPETGKQLWELGGMTGQPKASPVASDELLYVGTGGGFGGFGMPPGGGFGGPPGGGGPGFGGGFSSAKPLFAVKAGAKGDITPKAGEESSDAIAWQSKQAGPSTASPLLYQGHLYILEERGGVLSCYDAKTGKRLYRERIPNARGFTSSPWAADGKIFCLDDGGATYVIKAGAEFEVLGENALGEMFWSSPAVAGNALILRGVDHVFCIR